MNQPVLSPRRALLFDLDGTLIHSLPDLAVAINALLAEWGRASLSEAAIGAMVGDGAALLVQRALAATGDCPADIGPARARFVDLYTPNAARFSRPYPQMEETLSRLKDDGWVLAVCTNKPGPVARVMLERMGLIDLFAAVVGGGDTPALKPDPTPILTLMQRLDVSPSCTIMVGDTENDVKAAHNAGVKAVLVQFGYGKGDLAALGADVMIPDFPALPAAVARLYAP